MTTQWNDKTMEEAQNGHYFIPVSDLGKDQINISDAEEIWKSNPDILFHTGARIVGLKDDIVTAFTENGIDESTIETILTETLTAENYNEEMSGNYQKEMQGWKDAVLEANINSEGRKMTDIITIANGKAPITSETAKALSPTKKSPSTPGKGRGRNVTALQARIDKAIEEGKYLVVSKMKENGAGTTFAAPPTAGRARNFYNENEELPISSNDLEHFLMAIDLLEDGRELYAEDIERAEAFFSKEKKPVTPKTTPKTTVKTAGNSEEKEQAPVPVIAQSRVKPVISGK